jgi:type I restriction enzyme S subunit
MSQPASTVIETSQATSERAPLPDGWRWAKLGDICEVVTGSTPPKAESRFYGGTIAWIKPDDLDRAMYVDSSSEYLSEEGTKRARILPAGSVLVSCIGNIGKTAIAAKPLATNQQINSLIPSEDVDSDYLFFACRYIGSTMRDAASVSLVAIINKSSFSSLKIPLPPLPEQKRIAAILKEQMAAVERARVAAEAQLKAAKDLPAAYLREVFNNGSVQQWETKLLGEVGEIVSGLTLGRKFNAAANIKVPYLRVANVKDGHLDLTDVYEIEATASEVEKLRLKFGDLLLTEGGDRDKLGRGTFWEEQLPLCLHQNHIFRVRFDLSRYSPHFVSAQVGSPYGKAYFLAHAKQTTGIATINQQVLSKFPLLSPSLSEQTRVASILSEKTEGNDQIVSSLRTQLDTIEKIPAALLRQAFTGKL